ncbi:bacterial transcriptional activator domain-containing protein [Nocardioides sp. zg-DK7169]|uniref:AfsR/SARP family transcriptional regulator n=1 Tax=Nocardioides sp. zg-DK7169 TaxID=2736600 RepID=UPI0015559A6A|nr:transcriptional regulator [Nocardioides sp. zg-DK7169]
MDSPRPPLGRLALLGGLELSFDAQPVRVAPAAQRLLAVLAIQHRRAPASRMSLAERLWPDTAVEKATSNLRSILWRMPRPRARSLVLATATQVRLSDDLAVDLWEAEDLARALCADAGADPDALASLHLLEADLLPHWQEDWLLVDQEAHRQRRLHALEHSSRALRETGRFDEALRAALGAVRSEPLRESAHRRVIEVHLAEANHAAALRQYDTYRRQLADELGLPPSSEIRRLVGPLLGRPVDR